MALPQMHFWQMHYEIDNLFIRETDEASHKLANCI
ncbi:hypothetical protein NB311A_13576 [Nitrobacter sp. Nb-311A]|nr:hypothetical protein NB311A_13576 [Nitrobacter sp. Nb-311A]